MAIRTVYLERFSKLDRKSGDTLKSPILKDIKEVNLRFPSSRSLSTNVPTGEAGILVPPPIKRVTFHRRLN